MSVKAAVQAVVPKPSELVRESLIVLGGAVIAAIVLQHSPKLRAWIAERMPWAQSPGL